MSSLDTSVLVLNKLFTAVHVIPTRKAMGLLCKDLAEVVSFEEGTYATYNFKDWRDISEYKAKYFRKEGDDWVRTVGGEIQVPRVIRLLHYDRPPKNMVKFNRRNIFGRDDNRCQYCGKRFRTSDLSLDHVIPRSLGGPTTWENIVCACVACNARKGGRTPQQANMRLVRKPVKPKHSPTLHVQCNHHKYESWKAFLDEAYWSVELT